MTNLNQLPVDLPIPQDDGSTKHLMGMRLPALSLRSTSGENISLDEIKGKLVIYCYPMTGQPNVALPDGWDQIPGARGCTPQSCAFRDHYQELQELGAQVIGLSVQSTEYQKEMVDRLHLPFPVVSDAEYHLQQSFNHAKPIGGLTTHAAHVVACHGVAHHNLRRNSLAFTLCEQT